MNTYKTHHSHSKSPASIVNFDSIPNKNTSKIAQKVFNSIYSTRLTSSPEKPDISNMKQKLQEREQHISLSPIPLKYYRDPIKSSKIHQNLKNLTKKAKNSLSRPSTHKKVHSHQYSFNIAPSPSASPPPLLPMQTISNPPGPISSKKTKSLHCAALNQLASYCETFIKTPLQEFDGEKKKLIRNNQEMTWITKTLQQYGRYDLDIQNELIRFSNDSRLDLDKERAKIVGQIKNGSFDPNKTIVKLKTRIKRKSEDIY